MAATLYGIQGADLQLVPTSIQTSAYAADAQDLVLVNATSASVTVTLPAGAADKARVGVFLALTASGHVAAIAGNGATFNDDGTTTLNLALADQGVILQYNATLNAWYETAAVLSLAQLDGRYALLTGTTFTGHLAPAVVALTDAATIAINASLGNDYRVTLGGNRTLGNPSNPVDGQKILVWVIQPSSGGPYTLSLGSAYAVSASLAMPTLSTAANAVDVLGFEYFAPKSKWLLMAYNLDY